MRAYGPLFDAIRGARTVFHVWPGGGHEQEGDGAAGPEGRVETHRPGDEEAPQAAPGGGHEDDEAADVVGRDLLQAEADRQGARGDPK